MCAGDMKSNSLARVHVFQYFSKLTSRVIITELKKPEAADQKFTIKTQMQERSGEIDLDKSGYHW